MRLRTAAATPRAPLLSGSQFFQIDAFGPLLQFLRVLVLQFDLKKIAIGNHYPKRGVLTFLFECLETGVAIDGDRLAITFAGLAVVIPRSGGRADVIRNREC